MTPGLRRDAVTWAELAKVPLVEDQWNASGGDTGERLLTAAGGAAKVPPTHGAGGMLRRAVG